MANTRIKVPRTTLIDKLQERIDEATAQYEAEVARYEKEREEFLAELPKALKKKAAEIAAMKPDDLLEYFKELRGNAYDERATISIKIKWPTEIDQDAYLYTNSEGRYRYARRGFKGFVAELEKAKRILEASKEEFISVSATDFYADIL